MFGAPDNSEAKPAEDLSALVSSDAHERNPNTESSRFVREVRVSARVAMPGDKPQQPEDTHGRGGSVCANPFQLDRIFKSRVWHARLSNTSITSGSLRALQSDSVLLYADSSRQVKL